MWPRINEQESRSSAFRGEFLTVQLHYQGLTKVCVVASTQVSLHFLDQIMHSMMHLGGQGDSAEHAKTAQRHGYTGLSLASLHMN